MGEMILLKMLNMNLYFEVIIITITGLLTYAFLGKLLHNEAVIIVSNKLSHSK